ncbi:MAG: hypothetical protein Rhob2KO_05230 [Rhodopirellula baltica]
MATLGGILGGKQFLEYTDNPLKVPPQSAGRALAPSPFSMNLLSPHPNNPSNDEILLAHVPPSCPSQVMGDRYLDLRWRLQWSPCQRR